MKKSLLALAVLGAFAGAASAQSSVTIYGKIDLGIAKANEAAGTAAAPLSSSLAGAPTTDKVTMQPGARNRVGFRGTEDLGGGLKGVFNLEHSLSADDGASLAGQPMWSQAWLGLSGGFGEVRLGRDYAPIFYPAVAADPFGYDTVGQAGAAHTLAGLGVTRHNNQISYKTPSFAGVTAMVAFAPKEAATGENAFGANLAYAAGPLSVGFGFQNAGNQTALVVTPAVPGGAAAVTAAETSLYVLTAAYDLGFVRPMFLYAKGTADNAAGGEVADHSNIQIGATAPLGGGELKAVYAQLERDNNPVAGLVNTDVKKFGVGYHYPLSKRTKVYADLGTAKETGLERRTAFDVGVQHNF